MKLKQIFMQYKFTFLCVLAIIVLSLYPVQETPLENVTLSDKLAHFLMYGGLSAIISIETLRKNNSKEPLRKNNSIKTKTLKLLRISLLYPILLGILMELAQTYLTTYRSGDILDAIANSLGALFSFLPAILYLLLRRTIK